MCLCLQVDFLQQSNQELESKLKDTKSENEELRGRVQDLSGKNAKICEGPNSVVLVHLSLLPPCYIHGYMYTCTCRVSSIFILNSTARCDCLPVLCAILLSELSEIGELVKQLEAEREGGEEGLKKQIAELEVSQVKNKPGI